MNRKEIGELRRRWRPNKNAVSRIYGCFVNSAKEIVSDLDEPLGTMPEEEAEKYLGLLKKTLSGTLGKNLIDLVFSTEQVADSAEHRLLMGLRESGLKDGALRAALYRKVIDSLDLEETNYLILLACDAYDVPHRHKDLQRGDSEEVFTYLLCGICPVREGKPTLGYFPGDNEFHYTVNQVVSAPELGFLFPAFDARTANIYNALYYSRRPEELHQELLDAVFHIEPPMSAAEQKEVFQDALQTSLEEACSMEVMQAVHECLNEKLAQHKQSKDPEPPAMTAGEIGGILQDCGVSEERVQKFETRCEEEFGDGAALNPANLIDSGRFVVKTEQAVVLIDPACSYLLETRAIDGKNYLLIPVEQNVEVNGMPVHTFAEKEE